MDFIVKLTKTNKKKFWTFYKVWGFVNIVGKNMKLEWYKFIIIALEKIK